jgi:hypothetical protein
MIRSHHPGPLNHLRKSLAPSSREFLCLEYFRGISYLAVLEQVLTQHFAYASSYDA